MKIVVLSLHTSEVIHKMFISYLLVFERKVNLSEIDIEIYERN
jgi:hypothetical protein